ncbi:hypothetical protein [Sporomusa sp. KB1]|jgi:hypothetical protein|uniref:hypothetical protein n=1 Tax=Sporomusa sp. KB1 TaxID=943346 RepID=UPI0011A3DA64|nr:hypothetical protein [Sporomusa sp. KB1]
MLDGYEWRREQDRTTTAYFVSRLINVWIKNPISAKDLLEPLNHPETKRNDRKKDEEYLRKKFKKVLRNK